MGLRLAFAFPLQSYYPDSWNGARGTSIFVSMDSKNAPKTGTSAHDEQSG